MQPCALTINAPRETGQAQTDSRFQRVGHVFHTEWHGIRSATSCLPGHKIGIPGESPLTGEALRRLVGFVYEEKLEHIIYQGYSANADQLARHFRQFFRGKIKQYAVTHLTSTQFENYFEVEMQRLLLTALSDRIFERLGSVKPGFDSVLEYYWPKLVLNCTPNLRSLYRHTGSDPGYAFVPLEKTIRKNLYTNIIAALRTDRISEVLTVNEPTGLSNIRDTHRCHVIGFQRGRQLLERMADASIVLNCTLAECQPMTQLESLAVGTPCLTGRLGIEELEHHPVTQLTEVTHVDNPAAITRQIDRVIDARTADPLAFQAMLNDYISTRNALALERLAEFVGV